MDIGARRVFRLSLTVAATLAAAYGLALDMPFIAPVFAFMFTAAPKPPMGLKGLVGLILLLLLTMGVGLLLIPLLINYRGAGLLLVLLGLFFCNYLTLNLGKAPVGTLLTMGVALVSSLGMMGFQVATGFIQALAIGIGLAVVCQWIVYPLFPEDTQPPAPPPAPPPVESSWLALRATLIVFPSFLLGLINPSLYLPIVMKAVALGQQTSAIDARTAGRELLGSTVVGGIFAILFWTGLSLMPTLWMFFLWMLVFAIFISGKFYGVIASRYPPTFWLNVFVTQLILLGPAVADSADGKDPFMAFAVRMSLFITVTIYAWLAVVVLDRMYERSRQRSSLQIPAVGVTR